MQSGRASNWATVAGFMPSGLGGVSLRQTVTLEAEISVRSSQPIKILSPKQIPLSEILHLALFSYYLVSQYAISFE